MCLGSLPAEAATHLHPPPLTHPQLQQDLAQDLLLRCPCTGTSEVEMPRESAGASSRVSNSKDPLPALLCALILNSTLRSFGREC